MINTFVKRIIIFFLLFLVVMSFSCTNSETKNTVNLSFIEYKLVESAWYSYCYDKTIDSGLGLWDDDSIFFATIYKYNSVSLINFPPISCFQNAKNCDDYYACHNNTVLSSCYENPYKSCNGDIYERCEYGIFHQEDCSKRGLTCVVEYFNSDNPSAKCGIEGVFCDNDYCHDDYAVWCPGDSWVFPGLMDCASINKTCVDGSCFDKDESQAAKFYPCDGNLISSFYREHYTSFDCHALDKDFICSPTNIYGNEDQAECMIPLEQHACTNREISCNGDIATICIMGKEFEIDCGKIDGATCDDGRCVDADDK